MILLKKKILFNSFVISTIGEITLVAHIMRFLLSSKRQKNKIYIMQNIFTQKDNQEIIERISKLTPNSQRLWGKMSVSQMLEHCQKPLEVATGSLELKRTFIGFLFGKIAKKVFIGNKPLSKNMPTVKDFIIKSDSDFDTQKTILVSRIIDFGIKGSSIIGIKTHPFFGEMTNDEWGILTFRHLDHHLIQFGV